ncbi:MAG: MotA/TolQ/ExbB proton channel family protein [Myxococcota bacterium]|jgi:biopolymer transport protein ExbB
MHITDLIVRFSRTGAGDAVMWFMVLLSVASVAVIIERALFFFLNRGNVRAMAVDLQQLFLDGRYGEAQALVKNARGFEARTLIAALEVAHLGKDAVHEVALSAQKVERLRFERGLAFLGTIGNNAPFIGLFGTVLEIIAALFELGTQSGGNVGAGMVMAKLSAALAATAVGLLVALPAVAFFNYFNRRLKTLQTGAEALVHVLAAHLKTPAKTKET